jgi:galacturonosyltransferase
MKDKILILANSSSGVYGFRKELIAALLEKNTVYVSTPDRGNMEDLRELGSEV